MMRKFLTVAALVLAIGTASAVGISSKHASLGLKAEPAAAQCLACHGGWTALAAATKGVSPNPHANHMGKVQCNACHSWNGESRLMCADCHSFPKLEKGLRGK